MSARLFGMKVSVFEISDYFDGDTKYYLSLDKTIHDGECYEEPDVSEDFVYASEESSDEKESDEKIFLGDSEIWRKKGLMALCEGVSTLYISLRDIVSELELRENGIRNFSVWCYSNFDITVISDTSRLDTERMAAFMRYSDYIMVPVETDIDKIAFEKRFFTQFMRSMSIPLSKLKYVGWEFSELHSVEHEAMIKSLGENAYLGTVGYDVQRKSVKNLKGQFYCESAAPWLRAQYGHIINNFMFNDMKTA